MPEDKNKKEQIEEIKKTSQGTKPLVFISHDNRDAELAEAFSKLLSSVSAGVLKSFRSSDRNGNQGIAYGVEWYPEIMKKLDNASDVVALLTQNSVDRPWILYEAGVAKGKLDTPLLGVAIGIPLNKANNGPFAQFQNSDDDIESLTKLVIQLVSRIPDAEPDKAVVRTQVEQFKKQAEEILSIQPAIETKEGELMEDSSIAKLFEEIKIMFQDLPARMDKNNDYSYKKKRRKIHPRMIDDLLHISEADGSDWGFIVLLSLFKDDMPWVYDMGKETFDILKSHHDFEVKDRAISSFRRMIKHTTHHPAFRDIADSKHNMMILEELAHLLDDFMQRTLKKM